MASRYFFCVGVDKGVDVGVGCESGKADWFGYAPQRFEPGSYLPPLPQAGEVPFTNQRGSEDMSTMDILALIAISLFVIPCFLFFGDALYQVHLNQLQDRERLIALKRFQAKELQRLESRISEIKQGGS